MIPSESEEEKTIIVKRNTLLEAMRRMMIIRGEQYQGVKMSVEKDYLELVSVNPDLGNVEEKIEVKYNSEQMDIGFNPKYFIEILQSMKSDMIYLDIKNQTNGRPQQFIQKFHGGYVHIFLGVISSYLHSSWPGYPVATRLEPFGFKSFDPESLDPELTTEGLTAERLVDKS